MYIDVCVGSDDVMRVEARGGRRRDGRRPAGAGGLTRLPSDGRTMDLLTLGMHNVGQSGPPAFKRKLYITYSAKIYDLDIAQRCHPRAREEDQERKHGR